MADAAVVVQARWRGISGRAVATYRKTSILQKVEEEYEEEESVAVAVQRRCRTVTRAEGRRFRYEANIILKIRAHSCVYVHACPRTPHDLWCGLNNHKYRS